MDCLMSKTLIAAASTALAGIAYLNGHYGISRDTGQLLADRRMQRRIEHRIKHVGDFASIYGHLKTASSEAEGL